MERKIGEIFTYEGKRYKVVPGDRGCKNCAFGKGDICLGEPLHSLRGKCIDREDNQPIDFIQIYGMEVNSNNKLTIDIPEGMMIDPVNSDFRNGVIKLKHKKDITYTEICNALDYKYYVDLSVPKANRDKLTAISELMSIADYFNGDWKPDWSNHNEAKYSIEYNHYRDKFFVDPTSYFTSDGCVYFKNRDSVESIINNPNFKWILNTIYKN